MSKLFLSAIFILAGFLSSSAQTDIFSAARNGDTELLEKLYKLNPDTINSTNAQGYSPIILACYYDRIDFIKLLLAKNVVLNEEPNSPTALQAAAYKGFTEAVKLLLDYGANPNIVDANGTSPLIYASQFNHIEIVDLLLKKGASVSYKDPNGFTALDYAEKLNQPEIISLLKATN